MGGYPVLKGASYVLAVVPDMVLENGTTQTTEKIVNPDSEYLKELPKHLRSFLPSEPDLHRKREARGFKRNRVPILQHKVGECEERRKIRPDYAAGRVLRTDADLRRI